jgi:hypothetical protein
LLVLLLLQMSPLLLQVLLLSPAERSCVTAGKLFNLVSSDTNTVGDFCTMAYGFLSAPLRIVVTMVLLYRWGRCRGRVGWLYSWGFVEAGCGHSHCCCV